MPLFLNDNSSAFYSFPAYPLLAARGNMKRHAQEMLEKKVRKKEKTISITQEKESLVGVIWLIMLNGELGGGKIGQREQISQHSWGRTLFGRVSKAHNTAFLLHASANSNWNSVSCHTSFRSVFFYWVFFFSFNFIRFLFYFLGEKCKCCLNFFFLVKVLITTINFNSKKIEDSHHIFFTYAIWMGQRLKNTFNHRWNT